MIDEGLGEIRCGRVMTGLEDRWICDNNRLVLIVECLFAKARTANARA